MAKGSRDEIGLTLNDFQRKVGGGGGGAGGHYMGVSGQGAGQEGQEHHPVNGHDFSPEVAGSLAQDSARSVQLSCLCCNIVHHIFHITHFGAWYISHVHAHGVQILCYK